MLLVIFAGGGGAALLYYASGMLSNYEAKLEEVIVDVSLNVDEASLPKLAEMHESMPLEAGLPAWQEPYYVSQHKQGVILRYIAFGLLTIGAVGLIVAIIGFFK